MAERVGLDRPDSGDEFNLWAYIHMGEQAGKYCVSYFWATVIFYFWVFILILILI